MRSASPLADHGYIRNVIARLRLITERNVMRTFDDYLKEHIKDPEFRAEYEALEPHFVIIQAMIDARNKTGLTKEQLAEKTGITKCNAITSARTISLRGIDKCARLLFGSWTKSSYAIYR